MEISQVICSAVLAIGMLSLVAGWTVAWLHWLFRSDLRQMLFSYVFPHAWRAGRDKEDLATLGTDEFEIFLAAESSAPIFIRGVFGCPACCSTYVAAVGLLLAVAGIFCAWLALPLLWATSAWIGHRLFHHA